MREALTKMRLWPETILGAGNEASARDEIVAS